MTFLEEQFKIFFESKEYWIYDLNFKFSVLKMNYCVKVFPFDIQNIWMGSII